MTPELIAFAFNTAPVANADIFLANIQPSRPGATGVAYKDSLTIGIDSTAAVVSIEFDINRGEVSVTDKTFALNGGASIPATSLNTFDIPMMDGVAYNVSLSISATVTVWISRSFNNDF